MMNNLWIRKSAAVLVASVFAAALATPVLGQTTSTTKQPATTNAASSASKANDPKMAARQMRASQLMGKDVRNAQGEDLGDIKDASDNMLSAPLPAT